MKITFKLFREKDLWGFRKHVVLVDDVIMMSQSEMMEREDVVFHRDLSSPFDCKRLIEVVIEKVKLGEEIEFEEIDIECEEGEDLNEQ